MRSSRIVIAFVLVAAAVAVGPAGAGAVGGPALQVPPADGASVLPEPAWYPRVIRLEHAGELTGSLLASTSTSGLPRIWRSTDMGASFTSLADIPITSDPLSYCCSSIFEFPVDLAAFPAGTLVFGSSVNVTEPGDRRQMRLEVFRSDDQGATWTSMSSCDDSVGGTTGTGGLWEPQFYVADDASLVCLYSSETYDENSQVLDLVRSTDGGQTWSEPQPVVHLPQQVERPGMGTVARLPDGTWAMTYEICGYPNVCTSFIRWSDDGLDWGDPGWRGERIVATDGDLPTHTPFVTWSPAGGPMGTLLLSSQDLRQPAITRVPGAGATLLTNTEGGRGRWGKAASPVAVTDLDFTPVIGPYDPCPNYSSPLLVLNDAGLVLELASFGSLNPGGPPCQTAFASAVVVAPPDPAPDPEPAPDEPAVARPAFTG